MDSSRMRHPSFRPAEEVHMIHGTDISISSKPGPDPDDLDLKAVDAIREIRRKGIIDWLEVLSEPFGMDPHKLPKGFFLCHGPSFVNQPWPTVRKENLIWRSHGSIYGYGIRPLPGSGYTGFKKAFVYHDGNHKTNWIMVVYLLVDDGVLRADNVVLLPSVPKRRLQPTP